MNMRLFAASAFDFRTLVFNFFFNTGKIVTSAKNIYLYQYYGPDYSRVYDAFTLGTEIGQVFYYAFYPYEIALN
jgi:hypothetical protein